MTEAFLAVAVYSSLIVAGSLCGGAIPSRFVISHLRMQIILSFVGGLMLGIGLLHLLPHSLEHLTLHQAQDQLTVDKRTVVKAIQWTFGSAMAGLLGMFFLIRLFHFHQHGPVTGSGDHECQHHDHAHHQLSWTGVAFGLSVHTLMDGVALGAAILADAAHSSATTGFAGFGVFLAIALHKPLDALSITTLMQSSGWSRRSQQLMNAGFAAMCPLGAVVVLLVGAGKIDGIDQFVGIVLGVSGGIFLCISLSDLLPEVQFHRHDRMKLSVALVLGVASAYLIGYLEPSHVYPNADTSAANPMINIPITSPISEPE